MIRASLPLSLVAAAVAAGLLSAPGVAAQSTERPAVAVSELGDRDASGLRELVNEEAVHRDRAARLARLRVLAEQRGQIERISEIDRLERVEAQRFEARQLAARSRMSEPALKQADDFVRRGGVMKLRRTSQSAAGHDAERARRPGNDAEAMRAQQARRTQATPSRPGKSPVRLGNSSRGGRSGSGGRSPR